MFLVSLGITRPDFIILDNKRSTSVLGENLSAFISWQTVTPIEASCWHLLQSDPFNNKKAMDSLFFREHEEARNFAEFLPVPELLTATAFNAVFASSPLSTASAYSISHFFGLTVAACHSATA